MHGQLKEINLKCRILSNVQGKYIYCDADKYFAPMGSVLRMMKKKSNTHTKHCHDGALLVPIQQMIGKCQGGIMEGACQFITIASYTLTN